MCLWYGCASQWPSWISIQKECEPPDMTSHSKLPHCPCTAQCRHSSCPRSFRPPSIRWQTPWWNLSHTMVWDFTCPDTFAASHLTNTSQLRRSGGVGILKKGEILCILTSAQFYSGCNQDYWFLGAGCFGSHQGLGWSVGCPAWRSADCDTCQDVAVLKATCGWMRLFWKEMPSRLWERSQNNSPHPKMHS